MSTVLKLVDTLTASLAEQNPPEASDVELGEQRHVLLRMPAIGVTQAAAPISKPLASQIDRQKLQKLMAVGKVVLTRMPTQARLVAVSAIAVAELARRVRRMPQRSQWATAAALVLALVGYAWSQRDAAKQALTEAPSWSDSGPKVATSTGPLRFPTSADLEKPSLMTPTAPDLAPAEPWSPPEQHAAFAAPATQEPPREVAPQIPATPWTAAGIDQPMHAPTDVAAAPQDSADVDWNAECPSTPWPPRTATRGTGSTYYDVQHGRNAPVDTYPSPVTAPAQLGQPPVARLDGVIATPRLK